MKPIKIDIKLNGVKVTNLEELRANFSWELLTFYEDSRLLTWLETRGLMAEAKRVIEISAEYKCEKMFALCDIFGVPRCLPTHFGEVVIAQLGSRDRSVGDHNGSTRLRLAVTRGDKPDVEWLIAKGADINTKGPSDLTLLHLAAGGGHQDAAALLITKGADINAKDMYGQTPLTYAIGEKHTDVAELLRQNGGV